MLSATACLLGPTNAYAASKAELAIAADVRATSSVNRIDSGIAPGNIIAANQRETNLRKTASFVIVSGIESTRRQRGLR
ncbi:MAG: hypothetical protein ABIM50_14120 [Novosphingobium sp.]